ncbi:predicted protein [Botrytis cinerea T4]|uniref:Uncharacterized protein n=1 Tax=Botryotinia fuckeliana (strain T4) TaxID=999810 RepID=G2Y2M4_BOTF4|nr:predicted protein [Botrytis cinerea T4]
MMGGTISRYLEQAMGCFALQMVWKPVTKLIDTIRK